MKKNQRTVLNRGRLDAHYSLVGLRSPIKLLNVRGFKFYDFYILNTF